MDIDSNRVCIILGAIDWLGFHSQGKGCGDLWGECVVPQHHLQGETKRQNKTWIIGSISSIIPFFPLTTLILTIWTAGSDWKNHMQ